jgi:hypothetical protein
VIVVDEYLAAWAVVRALPDEVPDEDLVLPTSRHWRILQALHGGRGGQLSRLLGSLSDAGREAIRYPHPEVLQVLDPRPLLDRAAGLSARFNNTGGSLLRRWLREAGTGAPCGSGTNRTWGDS